MIPSTDKRRFHDQGHMAPMSGLDNAGRPWRGTSRIIDRAARRAANKRTWRTELARERRAREYAKLTRGAR